MRIYTHGIIAYLLFINGTTKQKKLAVIGAILPDVLLSIGFLFDYAGDSVVVEAIHRFFHRSFMHAITEYLHSLVVAAFLLVLSLLVFRTAFPFFAGMLSHGVIDLLTHQGGWAYNHFLPFSGPVNGIVSYTSTWFTIAEHVFVILFFGWFFLVRNSAGKNKARNGSRRK